MSRHSFGRTSNPVLDERTFAPDRLRSLQTDLGNGPVGGGPVGGGPVGGGPVAGRRTTMSLDGVVQKCALLLVVLSAAGFVGWQTVERTEQGVDTPVWLLPAILVAFGLAIYTARRPMNARYTAPAYAVVQGLVVGAISAVYESAFDGIVLQAAMLTVGVFAVMLGAFATGAIKVTERFRAGVVAATGAVLVVYLVSLVLSLFGSGVPYIHESGPIGILFSLVVVGIAAMNLVLDFEFVARGTTNGAPRELEWYGAFGLLVTTVWLYIELIRLLSKLRSR